MSKLNHWFLATLLGASVHSANALDIPEESPYDHRVRSTVYNANDVVQLDSVIGTATHIQLEDDERYLTHAFGDSASYSFAIQGNHIFIKPTAEQADTNLIVVTDRRTYKFRLTFKPTREARALYSLTFSYPDSQQRAREEAARAEAVKQGFAANPRSDYNFSYSMAGDLDIAPVNVWDDNEFTYFKFPGNVDLPGVYLVGADGDERIVNRNTIGKANRIYSVHKVNSKWMLRLGSRALAVYNEAYDPIGVENDTRTTSPRVNRVLKGEDK